MTVLSGSEDANRCGVLELFINAYHHKSTEKNHLKTCRICLMKTFKTFRNFSKVICRKLEFRIRFRSSSIDVFFYVRSSYCPSRTSQKTLWLQTKVSGITEKLSFSWTFGAGMFSGHHEESHFIWMASSLKFPKDTALQ